jgi:hypothetical protein
MVVAVFIQRGSCLDTKDPSQTIFLNARQSQMTGSLSLAGDYSASFVPNL